MTSDAYDPSRSSRDQRKVSVTRMYEVECSQCGIVDSRRSRKQAEEAATLHRRRHREQPEDRLI
jgi:hypothetical protein